MAFSFALMIGLLAAAGVYLLLRADRFRAVLGLTLLSYAVNLFLLASGGYRVGAPPILDGRTDPRTMADPLPQGLVLTAIVIGFGMTAWLIALCLRMVTDDPSVDGPDGGESGA
jgi:multicomponent K+:H+ antiporter subunit C